MTSQEFRECQRLLGLDRKGMAKLLCISPYTVASYRVDGGDKKRNIPALVEKVLLQELVNRGQDPREIKV